MQRDGAINASAQKARRSIMSATSSFRFPLLCVAWPTLERGTGVRPCGHAIRFISLSVIYYMIVIHTGHRSWRCHKSSYITAITSVKCQTRTARTLLALALFAKLFVQVQVSRLELITSYCFGLHQSLLNQCWKTSSMCTRKPHEC